MGFALEINTETRSGSRGRLGPGGVQGQRPGGGPGGQSPPAENEFEHF